MKIQTVILAGALVLTPSVALAHNTKEKPEKPGPTVEVTPQSIERPTNPNTPEANACSDRRPECRYGAPTAPQRRSVTVTPAYPAPFRPMTLVPHVTRDYGAVERKLIQEKPKVSTFSVCKDRGLSLDCRKK